MKANIFDPACPTRQLLDRVGDKWTVFVVIALSEGRKRFGELRREIRGTSAKVLTDVLRSLERDGLVSRHVFVTVPLRVEYALTPLGRSLRACVKELRRWAERRMPQVAAARTAFDQRILAGDIRVEPHRGAERGRVRSPSGLPATPRHRGAAR